MPSLPQQLLLSKTIIKALKSHQDSEKEMATLITSIEKINSEFNAIAGIKSAIEKDEEMDFNSMTVTDNELSPIIASVKALRTSMVD